MRGVTAHGGRSRSTIARSRPITRWNLLALLAVLAGVSITLGLDHLSLHQWAQSGLAIPVGEHFEVELPVGETLVYYESRQNIVPDRILLDVIGANGERVRARPPMEENNFRLLLGGWSGRSLWNVRVEEAGTYRIRGFNADYLQDEQVPEDDRVVLFKQPRTLAEAVANRKVIQIVGASITMCVALLLYLLHWRALARAGARSETADADESLDAVPAEVPLVGEPGTWS
ncbi:MAG: hypothetical protein ACYTGG_08530 [Planctomycetota bacterium]|jgi:hypothetical protein